MLIKIFLLSYKVHVMEVEDDDALFEDDLDDVVLNEAVVNSFSRPKPPHRVVVCTCFYIIFQL